MAVYKLTDKPRKLPWCADIHVKGHPRRKKCFATKAEAEHWEAEQLRSIRLTGLPLTIEELKKHTVGEIVQRYLDEEVPTKGGRVQDASRLKAFLRRDICKRSLADISLQGKQAGYTYRRAREQEESKKRKGSSISPSTLRRELNFLQRVFQYAIAA
jgi:hypothetical protein